MSKVAVKRPAQYCLTFDDDNCRQQRFDSNIATDRGDTQYHTGDTQYHHTGRQYDHDFNNKMYKKAIEDLIVAQLKKTLEEEARRFKKKWNYDLTGQKFLSGDYCWETTKSAKSFPISYAKHCFYSYYGAQPLCVNSDESGVEPDDNLKSNNTDSGTVTPQQTTTTTTTDVLSNDEIPTETLTNTNDTRSIGNPVTTTICNESSVNTDGSLRLIPITCFKPRDSEGDIIDRQRPN